MKRASFWLAIGVGASIRFLGGCVGDEPATPAGPAPVDSGGPSNVPTNDAAGGQTDPEKEGGVLVDAGSDAAKPALPLIDQYTITKTVWTSTPITSQTDCVNKIDAAAKGMNGGYVSSSGLSAFGRYADRPGALVVAACIESSQILLTEAWGIKTASDPEGDEARLRSSAIGTTAGAVSPEVTTFPKLSAGQRIVQLESALPLSTCQNRAKAALTAVMAKAPDSPRKWTDTLGDFGASAGTDGSSGAITCTNNNGQAVIDVLSVDPTIVVATMLDTIETALKAAK